jgi:hypothetical protein
MLLRLFAAQRLACGTGRPSGHNVRSMGKGEAIPQ